MFSLFLTGLGLAVSCGLNAYLPLLILALADIMSHQVDLIRPWDILSSTWGIVVLLVLLPFELIPDKIANVDHVSDLIHSAIRPVAAAIAVVAVMHQDTGFNLVGAMLIGLVVGGSVHVLKMRARPAISSRSKGVLNPVVSLLEDGLAGILSILAIALPMSMLVAIPLALVLLVRQYHSLAQGQSRLLAIVPGARRTTVP